MKMSYLSESQGVLPKKKHGSVGCGKSELRIPGRRGRASVIEIGLHIVNIPAISRR